MKTIKKYLFLLFCFCISILQAFGQTKMRVKVQKMPQGKENEQIFVAGNFNQWNPKDARYSLKKQKDGTYLVVLPNVKKGETIEYKFTRGSWETEERKEGGEWQANRVTKVSATKIIDCQIANWLDMIENHTVKDTSTVIKTEFFIPQFQCKRRIWVYLPPDYHLSNRAYPVLYMQDGQNLFDDKYSFSGEWGIDDALQLAFAEGDPGIIVIGIDNGGSERLNEYSPWQNAQYGGGKGELYMDFLVNNLKPFVDSSFRTRPEREFTGLMGSSMGGLISMYGGMEYAHIFGKLGIFSPSFWFSDSAYQQVEEKGRKFPQQIYFLCGEPEGNGSVVRDMRKMYETLLKVGFLPSELIFEVKEDGQHSEWFWRREFPKAYKWLFAQESTHERYQMESEYPFELEHLQEKHILFIHWKAKISNYSIAIYNSMGHNVLYKKGLQENHVDISALNKGVYLVIITQNGVEYRKKILKS